MKKWTLGLLIGLLIVFLVGCSGGKIPDGMSKEAYNLGNEAIKVSQAFVDGDKTAASAYQELSDLYDECESLLKEDSETYTYDLLVSGYIASMEFNVGMNASFRVVDDIEDMKDLLTPIKESASISDIIVGSWDFRHDTGYVMKIQFKTNGTGTFSLYDKKGNFGGSDDFKYTIDEENKVIKGGSDGTADWYEVDNITNKSMDYTLVGSGISGTAYKD